jgi:hypothetical protein
MGGKRNWRHDGRGRNTEGRRRVACLDTRPDAPNGGPIDRDDPTANCIQPPIGRARRESIPRQSNGSPTVHTGGPQNQCFLVISYNPVTEAVHLDTELSDSPDAALSSVAGVRGLAHVLLAFTPEQLREMAANLEGCTAEQIGPQPQGSRAGRADLLRRTHNAAVKTAAQEPKDP